MKHLPEEIGDLKFLEVLNVVSNGLTRLPTSIGHMKCLKKLQISMNKLERLPNGKFILSCDYILANSVRKKDVIDIQMYILHNEKANKFLKFSVMIC